MISIECNNNINNSSNNNNNNDNNDNNDNDNNDINDHIKNNNTVIEGIYHCRCISQSITRHFIKWKNYHLKFDTTKDFINIIGNSTNPTISLINAKLCIHDYLHSKHYDKASLTKMYCLLITYIDDDNKESEIAIQYKSNDEMMIWYNTISNKINVCKSKREIVDIIALKALHQYLYDVFNTIDNNDNNNDNNNNNDNDGIKTITFDQNSEMEFRTWMHEDFEEIWLASVKGIAYKDNDNINNIVSIPSHNNDNNKEKNDDDNDNDDDDDDYTFVESPNFHSNNITNAVSDIIRSKNNINNTDNVSSPSIKHSSNNNNEDSHINNRQAPHYWRRNTHSPVILSSSSPLINWDVPIPKMNILILVVGTLGDVNPFIQIGQRLQKDMHRVRLATHACHREYIISSGLEYYPLAGDPLKLSEFMVKTHGHLIPTNPDLIREFPSNLRMLSDIINSCWGACIDADPFDPKAIPFVADAIISNPVSYAHIHCAEALGIPLHLMFPQPWCPTKSFPHPLSCLSYQQQWCSENLLSYQMVDELIWLSLEGEINNFRKTKLGLEPLRLGEGGSNLLNYHKVPFAKLWSPLLAPKPKDWDEHIDIVGSFPDMQSNVPYEPSQELKDFLEIEPKAVFIGFGSMIIENIEDILSVIVEGATLSGVRVILQMGWSNIDKGKMFTIATRAKRLAARVHETEIMTESMDISSDDMDDDISKDFFLLGPCPHSWLFLRVAAVIHHGGAGTTSTGIRMARPTWITPLFGDQRFWGEVIKRQGLGPSPVPLREITLDKVVESLTFLLSSEVQRNAALFSVGMQKEDGVEKAVEVFYKHLPVEAMVCDVSIFMKEAHLASIYCVTCGLKMCRDISTRLHRDMPSKHIQRSCYYVNWSTRASISGAIVSGVAGFASEVAGGMTGFASEVAGGIYNNGVTGAGPGIVKGLKTLLMSPLHGSYEFASKVKAGINNDKTDLSMRRIGRHSIFPNQYVTNSTSSDTNSTCTNNNNLDSTLQPYTNNVIQDIEFNDVILNAEIDNHETNSDLWGHKIPDFDDNQVFGQLSGASFDDIIENPQDHVFDMVPFALILDPDQLLKDSDLVSVEISINENDNVKIIDNIPSDDTMNTLEEWEKHEEEVKHAYRLAKHSQHCLKFLTDGNHRQIDVNAFSVILMNALRDNKETFDTIMSLVSNPNMDSDDIISNLISTSPDSKKTGLFHHHHSSSPSYRIHVDNSLKSVIIRLISKLSNRKDYVDFIDFSFLYLDITNNHSNNAATNTTTNNDTAATTTTSVVTNTRWKNKTTTKFKIINF